MKKKTNRRSSPDTAARKSATSAHHRNEDVRSGPHGRPSVLCHSIVTGPP
jgi:hypothetical protein